MVLCELYLAVPALFVVAHPDPPPALAGSLDSTEGLWIGWCFRSSVPCTCAQHTHTHNRTHVTDEAETLPWIAASTRRPTSRAHPDTSTPQPSPKRNTHSSRSQTASASADARRGSHLLLVGALRIVLGVRRRRLQLIRLIHLVADRPRGRHHIWHSRARVRTRRRMHMHGVRSQFHAHLGPGP
eukprot:3936947-Rhodomonas_salina.3